MPHDPLADLLPAGYTPPEDTAPVPVSPLTDEPQVETNYDPGNPWWGYDWQAAEQQMREAARAAWDALTPEEQEQRKTQIREWLAGIRAQFATPADPRPADMPPLDKPDQWDAYSKDTAAARNAAALERIQRELASQPAEVQP